MKSSILIQLITIPAILANFLELAIVVKDDVYGVKVAAKGTSEGKITLMDASTINNIDSSTQKDDVLMCLNNEKHEWTSEECTELAMYRQVASLNFAEPTKEPRPFTIIEKAFTFQTVSPALTVSFGMKLTKQCTVTVTGEGKYVWDTVDGFKDVPTKDAIKIDCGDKEPEYRVIEKIEQGTASETEKALMAGGEQSIIYR
jgi:hypothetical protein